MWCGEQQLSRSGKCRGGTGQQGRGAWGQSAHVPIQSMGYGENQLSKSVISKSRESRGDFKEQLVTARGGGHGYSARVRTHAMRCYEARNRQVETEQAEERERKVWSAGEGVKDALSKPQQQRQGRGRKVRRMRCDEGSPSLPLLTSPFPPL